MRPTKIDDTIIDYDRNSIENSLMHSNIGSRMSSRHQCNPKN